MNDGLQEMRRKDKERNLSEYLNDILISNIRAHRINKGISQRKLSRMSGVTQNIISRMENHLAIPEFETLIKLAQTLDLDVDILIKPKEKHEDTKISGHQMETELSIGSRIKHIDTGQVFEIVTFQGYMNYNTGIERVDVENPDTEYIKNEDIGVVYKLI